MEKIKKITELCTQAKGLFEQVEDVQRDISTLEAALHIVGGKNDAIEVKIQEYQGKEELGKFSVLISEIKQAVKDAFSDFFSQADEKFSLETFNFETDELYRNPIRKVVFKEKTESGFIEKAFVILLEKEWGEDLLSLSKITNHDDGRGGGKHNLVCQSMKDGTIKYKSGYYRTAEGPPFQAGYDYVSIPKEEFWKQF